MIKQLVIAMSFLALIGGAHQAQAMFMIEPYLNIVASGEYEQDATGTTDLSGMVYGARLGASMLGLMGGIEYMGGKVEDDNNDEFKPADIGVFVGYELPILLRVYGTYFVKSKWTVDDSDFEGTGVKVGVGYTGLPFVSVNVEYGTWDHGDIDGATAPTGTALKSKLVMVGISLPLP